MPDARISLSLVLHNHQPVGNFGFVLEENHERAYRPMLDALERHPGVHVGLHYTGPLLAWLREEKPATIELLRGLVEREQVEILGGGLHEPVLASLPERDRVGQLTRMAASVADLFGRRPRGAWLAERVWEPDLPVALTTAGYEYTILDDAHLRAASIPDERHWGIHTTDDRGHRLLVFGTEQGLRYHIPFRPVEDVIEHLRAHATGSGEVLGMMGDDGEKFGGWPTTWDLCWGEEAWVERFFTALDEHAGWLTTLRPSDAIERFEPIGRIYIPTGSYAEMGEWSLPVEARRDYTRVLHAAVEEDRPEARWMRGGFWRNFQVIYREINDLHKQMLRASDAVAALDADDPRTARVVDHLYRGQSNDCYWHGLFGGIYLSHMRLATAHHLIAAEDAADRLGPAPSGREASDRVSVHVVDLDLDGRDDVLVTTAGQVLRLAPSEGGGIGGWDVRASRHALTSVMRRRPEAYHDTLRAIDTDAPDGGPQGASSIHDIVKVTEPGLAERLWYDAYERRSGLLRVLPVGTTIEALERAEATELGDLVSGPFEVVAASPEAIVLERRGSVGTGDGGTDAEGDRRAVVARTTITPGGDRRDPTLALSSTLTNESARPIEALLGLEWSLNMLGGGGNPQAWLRAGGEDHRFDTSGELRPLDELSMGNDGVGVSLRQVASPGASAGWFSIETISLSEAGFERNHQGTSLLWAWPLRLAPGESMTVSVESRVSSTIDHAEVEVL